MPGHVAKVDPAVTENSQTNPAEFYRRTYTFEDEEKKSPVDVPAECDVMNEKEKAKAAAATAKAAQEKKKT